MTTTAMHPEYEMNEYGANRRVCSECGKPVSDKKYGWTRCTVGWQCGAVVCATCIGAHRKRHEETK